MKFLTALALGLLVTGTAMAAPYPTGRKESPDVKPSEIGLFSIAADRIAVGSAYKYATREEIARIKSMGDKILRQPKGQYILGHTTFEWNIQGAKRRMAMVMWIDGDYAPDMMMDGINSEAAKVEFCRAIGVTFIDHMFTLDGLKDIFNREVDKDYPHLDPSMSPLRAHVIWGACKRKGSDDWALTRSGNGTGRFEWVYLWDYRPGTASVGWQEWAPIPNHRRNDEALRNMRNTIVPPVNRYDAALMPTPGDTDGMKDIDPATRGNQ